MDGYFVAVNSGVNHDPVKGRSFDQKIGHLTWGRTVRMSVSEISPQQPLRRGLPKCFTSAHCHHKSNGEGSTIAPVTFVQLRVFTFGILQAAVGRSCRRISGPSICITCWATLPTRPQYNTAKHYRWGFFGGSVGGTHSGKKIPIYLFLSLSVEEPHCPYVMGAVWPQDSS